MLKSGFFKNPASFFEETNLSESSESTLAASENDLGGLGAGEFGDGFIPPRNAPAEHEKPYVV